MTRNDRDLQSLGCADAGWIEDLRDLLAPLAARPLIEPRQRVRVHAIEQVQAVPALRQPNRRLGLGSVRWSVHR
jgi:hypothetical protein